MLSYDDHAILILYRLFYDIEFSVKRENNIETHIMTQKMGYLMDRSIIPVGDYGFFWGKYGPYSECLENRLQRIDVHPVTVAKFYEEYPKDSHLLFNEDINSFFSLRRLNKVNELSKALCIHDHREDARSWVELLSSLLYVYQTGRSNETFETVNMRLNAKRDCFKNNDINRNAWEALKSAGLVTVA